MRKLNEWLAVLQILPEVSRRFIDHPRNPQIVLRLFISVITIHVLTLNLYAQPDARSKEADNILSLPFRVTERGLCRLDKGLLVTENAAAEFGDSTWHDYELSFTARNPSTESQVQIWGGFRALNRDDRYVVGLRGGEQNSLYLSRMGYMGTDEFLGLRMLDFKPKTGEWYTIRIAVLGNRIRVFLNDEKLPRIDVLDKNSRLAPAGKVVLGGGWIKTEYRSLSVSKLTGEPGKPAAEYQSDISVNKEKQRSRERDAYKSRQLSKLENGRTTISLNGNWLFMPGYQLSDQEKAVSPKEKDQDWHVMSVPNFWNPIRIWLHGETFGPHAKGTSDTYYQQETSRCETYTFDYKKTSFAWYRQWIELPDNINNKHSELVFDAVSKIAEVWINGVKAGDHTGMFGEFKVDGSKLFRPGKNLVTVKVVRDFVKDITDAGKIIDVAVSVEVTNRMLKDLAHGFYGNDPAGIWQPVSLVITEPVKIEDVYIQPNLKGAKFDLTVNNFNDKEQTFRVVTEIRDKKTGELFVSRKMQTENKVAANTSQTVRFSMDQLQPKLWTPQSPNLYDFTFRIVSGNTEMDALTVTSGFRTFESKDGFLWLNGNKYWLRGGNHTPFALAPNDRVLADTFFSIMKRGNIDVTRTHTSPWNELWMNAADSSGIGVSFEGSWPWLFLSTSMPDLKLVDLWAEEFLGLLKKYRNHPSLLLWTVNNEMKFYDNDPDIERAKLKMKIISEVVKKMRKVDPSRPIVFDSNYRRKKKRFGEAFYADIDDGDIDDIHAYINWYDHSLFNQFRGEFQAQNKNEGRPLISQEMSSGYPNNETGHATRFYTLVHQTPSSLIGKYAYENADPANFLTVQSFITGEQAEAFRRSNEKASGIIHFALLTWFRNVYDAKKIQPYPTYYAMQRALSPVLVSAELWGRNFYAGDDLPVRVCVVNDLENGKALAPSVLTWKLVTTEGKIIATDKLTVPAVGHYERSWLKPAISIPVGLPMAKQQAKLMLELRIGEKLISSNEYALVLATKAWSQAKVDPEKKITLVDHNNTKAVFDRLGLKAVTASIDDALRADADLLVLSGIDSARITQEQIAKIRGKVKQGSKVLLLGSPSVAAMIFPDHITGYLKDDEGDIANMEIPESRVFDGIEPLELRYFNNRQDGLPAVCTTSLKIKRSNQLEALASHVRIHGYVNGEMEARSKFMETIKGFPVVRINDNGSLIASTMMTEKGVTDPVAGRLLCNMINDLLK